MKEELKRIWNEEINHTAFALAWGIILWIVSFFLFGLIRKITIVLVVIVLGIAFFINLYTSIIELFE